MNKLPIGNIVILTVTITTSILVTAMVLGSILGRPIDADARGIVLMFVGATLALFGGIRLGESGKEEEKLDAFTLGKTTGRDEQQRDYLLAMREHGLPKDDK